jgi:hypothetical protein
MAALCTTRAKTLPDNVSACKGGILTHVYTTAPNFTFSSIHSSPANALIACVGTLMNPLTFICLTSSYIDLIYSHITKPGLLTSNLTYRQHKQVHIESLHIHLNPSHSKTQKFRKNHTDSYTTHIKKAVTSYPPIRSPYPYPFPSRRASSQSHGSSQPHQENNFRLRPVPLQDQAKNGGYLMV